MIAIKEEVTSRAGSEQGEEEMEVDSADEQDEEARSQGGQAQSQVSKSNNTGATFNTLSSLGSLRPGIIHTHTHSNLNACFNYHHWNNQSNFHLSTFLKTPSLVDGLILFHGVV